MARVPVINERSVQQQGLPAAYQRINGIGISSFGGDGSGTVQGGRELQQAGDTLGDFALQMQAENNDMEARQLETEWRSRVAAMLYGNQQTQGYFSTKSNDAIAGFAPTRQQIEELRSEIEGRASNDAVRSIFADVSTGQMLANLDRMGAHLGAERTTAQVETAFARTAQYTDDAIADPLNPIKFNEASAVLVNETQRVGDLRGWSEEVTQQAIAEQYDILGKGVVEATLVNDPDAALALFDDIKALMSGAGRAGLAKTLDDVTLVHRAQEAAGYIRSLGLSYTGQLDYARGAHGGELEDAIVAEINQRHNETQNVFWNAVRLEELAITRENRRIEEQGLALSREIASLPVEEQPAAAAAIANDKLWAQVVSNLGAANAFDAKAEAARYQAAYESVSTAINNGGSLDDWMKTEPDLWRVLSTDAQTVNAIRSYERARIEGVVTDLAVYGELMNLTDAEIRTGGVPMLARARANMSDIDFRRFQSRYDEAVNPAGQIESGVSREDAHALLRSRAEALEIDLGSDKGGKFMSMFLLRLDALREEGPVTLPGVNQLIDELTREVITDLPWAPFGRAPFGVARGPAYTVPPVPASVSDLEDGKAYMSPDGTVGVWFADDQVFRTEAP